MFVIILSDDNLEQENNDVLCPELFEFEDFKNYIQPNLSKSEIDLFKNWYEQVTEKSNENSISYYKLKHQFLFDSNSSVSTCELDQLLATFQKIFDQNSNENINLKSKYLKSIQQNEIEFAVKHINPAHIVWLNISQSNSAELSVEKTNYKNVLTLLQSHVLVHNYQEFNFNCLNQLENQTGSNEKTVNDFLFDSARALIDAYVLDLNKKQINNYGLSNLFLKIFFNYNFKLCFNLNRNRQTIVSGNL